MMQRRFSVVLAAALAVGLAISAARADDAAVRKALSDIYARTNAAFKRKDTKAMLAMLAPDAMLKMKSGQTFNRQQMEQLLKMQIAMVKTISKQSTRIDRLTVKGNRAVAVVTETFAGTMADPQGKMHTIEQRSTSRDTWTKTAKGWKLKLSEEIASKATMDGKPMPGQ